MQLVNVIAIWIGYSFFAFAIVAVIAMPIVYGVMASVALWNWIAARFGGRHT